MRNKKNHNYLNKNILCNFHTYALHTLEKTHEYLSILLHIMIFVFENIFGAAF